MKYMYIYIVYLISNNELTKIKIKMQNDSLST